MKPLQAQAWQKLLRPGSRIFVGGGAGFPSALVAALLDCAGELADIELVHGAIIGGPPWARHPAADSFTFNAVELDPVSARLVRRGRADFTPAFSSEIPGLFTDGIIPLDAALIHVSPPDARGFCSLGASVDIVAAAVRASPVVIAQINPAMPCSLGQGWIHIDEIDAFLEAEEALPEQPPAAPQPEDETIARYVAQLVPHGATIHVGTGALQAAILRALADHEGLGLHTDTLTDAHVPLLERGVINNRRKTLHPRKTIATRCLGSQSVYAFVADNPHVELHPTEYVNSPAVIARNDRMVSITGAREADLSGQVVAESAGDGVFAGIGSTADFFRGAVMSRDGVPIIAMRSTRDGGRTSAIRAALRESAGIATSRGHVHYIVTEYGVATLRGRSVRERALELIQVAHPDFREQLLRAATRRGWVPAYQKKAPKPVSDLGDLESRTVELRGTTFLLRPLHSSDMRRLQEFFYSHTQETIQMRYGHAVARMPRERAYDLVNVDQSRDLALGIFETQGPRQIIHAVGRFYVDRGGRSAEVAFVVSEARRRHGMASLLMRTMMEVAERRGIRQLWGHVRRDNLPMIALFRKFGGKPVEDADTDANEMKFVLPVVTQPASPRPRKPRTGRRRQSGG